MASSVLELLSLPDLRQVMGVVCSFLFCGIIGLERELRHKDAGIRTHVLVGLGSCLFTVVSQYGMPDQLTGNMRWDASRIAAQIVSGIGFIGAGVIFFNHDTVRGLTTASAIWVVAAIGTACGAGMLAMAAIIVVMYLILVLLVAPAVYAISRRRSRVLRVAYEDSRGILRQILLMLGRRGLNAQMISCRQQRSDASATAIVDIRIFHPKDVDKIMAEISAVEGVLSLVIDVDEQ